MIRWLWIDLFDTLQQPEMLSVCVTISIPLSGLHRCDVDPVESHGNGVCLPTIQNNLSSHNQTQKVPVHHHNSVGSILDGCIVDARATTAQTYMRGNSGGFVKEVWWFRVCFAANDSYIMAFFNSSLQESKLCFSQSTAKYQRFLSLQSTVLQWSCVVIWQQYNSLYHHFPWDFNWIRP